MIVISNSKHMALAFWRKLHKSVVRSISSIKLQLPTAFTQLLQGINNLNRNFVRSVLTDIDLLRIANFYEICRAAIFVQTVSFMPTSFPVPSVRQGPQQMAPICRGLDARMALGTRLVSCINCTWKWGSQLWAHARFCSVDMLGEIKRDQTENSCFTRFFLKIRTNFIRTPRLRFAQKLRKS